MMKENSSKNNVTIEKILVSNHILLGSSSSLLYNYIILEIFSI